MGTGNLEDVVGLAAQSRHAAGAARRAAVAARRAAVAALSFGLRRLCDKTGTKLYQ